MPSEWIKKRKKMQIHNYRDVIDKPSVIGEFDLYLPALQMTIYNCRVIRSKKGNWFANLPSYSKEIDGVRKFYPYVSFSSERQLEFNRQLKELLKEFVKE